MKKWSAFSFFAFLTFVAHAEETLTSTSQLKLPSEKIQESSTKLSPSVTLGIGSTSNATLLNNPTPGTFTKVSPSFLIDYSPLEDLLVTGSLEGTLKHFPDSQMSELANEHSIDAKTDVAWFLNDNWELGSNLSFLFLENHIPTVGADSVSAQRQKYYQPELRLYAAWNEDAWSAELGMGSSPRRYLTTTTDIQGNLFKNSYDDSKVDGKVGYRFSKETRLGFKSTLEQKKYQERMAEFTDGLPVTVGSTNPNLVTVTQDNELQLKTKVRTIDLNSILGLRFEKDQVFGARDSVRYKFKQKAAISLPYRLSLEPEVSISRQDYSNFRSDVNDPKNSPLRTDWDTQVGTTLKWPMRQSITLSMQYAYNRKSTNYAIENYIEHVIETGMGMQF
ncbi:MAG: hypothetical protein AB7O96_20215 [Pseudobdellovibrionaceae bacterium]